MTKEEQKIEQELKKVETELKKDEQEIKETARRISMRGIIALVLILAAIGGGIGAYLLVTDKSVYIENSTIEAPEIDLAPTTPGILQNMYVEAGDTVTANEVVARVGNELIQTKIAGLVTMANANIGQQYAAGQTVVAMIDPTALRVVGQIDENKGLNLISVGQYATFTVDAFGSEKFSGIVDEVSPEAQSSDVVFQISDKREEQIFDVKVRFDTTQYPDLKNGMSARLWVYTK
jgi:multidrug resistance efflux pump